MRYARFRQLIARNRYPKASVLIRVPSLVIDIVEALATIQDHDGSCPAAMWAAVATSRGMAPAAIRGRAAVNLPSISEDMFDSSVRVGIISNVSSTRSDLELEQTGGTQAHQAVMQTLSPASPAAMWVRIYQH